jgi:hypothetical protein
MTKYRIVSTFLKWPYGRQFEVVGHNPCCLVKIDDYYLGQDELDQMLEYGLAEKIEEEKVKDYKITVMKHKSLGVFFEGNDKEFCKEGFDIHAVRRLSDGVEFKVGQEVKAINSEKVFTIKEFKEGATHLKIYVTRFGQDAGLAYIDQLSPLPEKKVLFISYDGFQIKEGDTFWIVKKKDFQVIGPCQTSAQHYWEDSSFLRFSAKEVAEGWVKKHSMLISVFDLENLALDSAKGLVVKMDDIYGFASEKCGFKPE